MDVDGIYRQWQDGTFPGHFFMDTHLPHYGMEVVLTSLSDNASGGNCLCTQHGKFTCREHFDIIYASTFRGLELIIFTRAIRLFRRPVCVWHHQPIVKAKNPVRELIARLFYRGMDGMFSSQKLIDDSLSSAKAKPERMFVARWGADLEYYDRLAEQYAMSLVMDSFPRARNCGICPHWLRLSTKRLRVGYLYLSRISGHQL